MLYVLLPPQPQLYAEAEKQQKMAKRKDYYKILGVDQSASTRDIKTVSELAAEMTSSCASGWLLFHSTSM